MNEANKGPKQPGSEHVFKSGPITLPIHTSRNGANRQYMAKSREFDLRILSHG